MNIEKLPNEIAVFPLSNVIFFPKTNLPLNIFEKRYVQMINDSLKKDRLIGIIQPKSDKKNKCNDLYSIGCLGKIDSFSETDDGRFIINLMGISRFKIEKEIEKGTLYRNFLVNYSSFSRDLINKYNLKRDTNFKTLFNKIKILFKRKKYLLNWKELEKLDLQLLINTIAMIAPFNQEEKQSLIETSDLAERLKVMSNITSLYLHDNFENKTVQ